VPPCGIASRWHNIPEVWNIDNQFVFMHCHSTRVRCSGCEDDPSLLSDADVQNAWSSTSMPTYTVMVLCLIKHSSNLTSSDNTNTQVNAVQLCCPGAGN
jgi:hypothetical protein